MAWSHVPASMVQHEALIENGELPLWNRYNSAGTDLLGQGQLMFGDPLHFLVLAANGEAWAWDTKYVVAKLLFAFALGCIVLVLVDYRPAAWLTAATAPFIGFFLYRLNHPAIFSMCYAPLILLGWAWIVRALRFRSIAGATILLVLANVMEMTSGTAKEAYMLMLCMNFTGALLLAFSKIDLREKLRRFVAAAAAGVGFVLLSAPLWHTFLDALHASYTAYNAPFAFQAHPALLIGLFDEIFYRTLHAKAWTWNPSANLLVLMGVLYVAATWRRQPADRTKTALAVACIPPFALAFGVVPESWITKVPFLGNVAHVDNTFSCTLIILLIVLAAFGFKVARERLATSEGRGDLVVCGLVFSALVILWLGFNQVIHREPHGSGTFLPIRQGGLWRPPEPYVWGQLAASTLAGTVLAWLSRRSWRRGTWSAAGVIVASTCVVVLLWRFGAHGPTRFDIYTFNPPVRVDFHATSPGVEYLKNRIEKEPARVAGFVNVLLPGWSAAYRFEGISGPDALINPVYRELTTACGIERVWDWRLVVRPETFSQLHRAYDMLNLRYFLGLSRPVQPPEDRLPARLKADLVVMESESAWPRAFFTDHAVPIQNATEFVHHVTTGDGRPFAAALPDTFASLGLPGGLDARTIVNAHDYLLTPNTTTFTVEAPSRGLVVLQEAWQPRNFLVTVNGREAKCLRMNFAFKGVVIDQPGTHRITFRHRPAHLGLDLIASMAGAVGLALLWYSIRKSSG